MLKIKADCKPTATVHSATQTIQFFTSHSVDKKFSPTQTKNVLLTFDSLDSTISTSMDAL